MGSSRKHDPDYNRRVTTMKQYYVTHSYTVTVEAEDEEEAVDKGYEEFRNQLLNGLGAGDFATHDDVEEVI